MGKLFAHRHDQKPVNMYVFVVDNVQRRAGSGAIGGTRTLTPVKEQRPQRCASTNSATTAIIMPDSARVIAEGVHDAKSKSADEI